MKTLKNKNIVFLGYDEDTRVLVEFLTNKGNSCFIVTSLENSANFLGATLVDENYIFENADKFDYVVRSRCVDPLNPNVTLIREVLIVYNMVSFFFELFDCKSIFVIGGSVIAKAAQRLLDLSESGGAIWSNSQDLCLSLNNILEEKSTMAVLIHLEDLIDMGFVPDLILISEFPQGNEGTVVENYLRTLLLFSSIRGKKVKIIGEDCGTLKNLKKDFVGSTFLFSINNSDSDYFIDGLDLIDKNFILREDKLTLSRFKLTASLRFPMTDTQLIQLFALSSVLGLKLKG